MRNHHIQRRSWLIVCFYRCTVETSAKAYKTLLLRNHAQLSRGVLHSVHLRDNSFKRGRIGSRCSYCAVLSQNTHAGVWCMSHHVQNVKRRNTLCQFDVCLTTCFFRSRTASGRISSTRVVHNHQFKKRRQKMMLTQACPTWAQWVITKCEQIQKCWYIKLYKV